MRDIYEPLKELNTTLVAVTPQISEKSIEMTEKHKLQFDMLSDPGTEYLSQLGIRFQVHPDLREVYLGFGNDLAVNNADPNWHLPIPTRLVIDQEGTVREAEIGLDYTHRPEPEKTLEDVRRHFG